MNTGQLDFLSYLEHETAARPQDFIPVYEPWLAGRERDYVLDAVESGWISSLGAYVERFEQEFARFCGVDHAVSVSNGTTALHLALHALGVGHGDEVIVPALSFVASANAVRYTGATPVFVDIDPATWTLDVGKVEAAITPHTRAVMPVHLYGHPVDMPALNALATSHRLAVVEDAAEAHGAMVDGRRTGAMGTIGAFSFYANKIITTGEGGMLTTDDAALASRCRLLRDHAMPPERRYWHDEVGFNYRLTNLQAAVGVAQMEQIDHFIARKRHIAALYQIGLEDIPGMVLPVEARGCTNVYWMYSILVTDTFPLSRDKLMGALRSRNVDTRPFFHPLDTLPPYRRGPACPVALDVARRGLNLPSSAKLSDEQVAYVCATIQELAA